ncbi:TonB-dependent receptor domain-containing protein [Pseudoduganella violacea]|uniref:Iron complex outermembrane receptor protein/hemoglobin/transferrin/lactoferrin receptor protein n=1 Tax=Pseudoduganella violacea TaxID=1715466 RepID=A0A7W5FSF2_9BURK|nr:TonB-dependent receptor [Pseudoduganella violacea]MBB3117665.1 iron complex outermembrane receptor protein/hemoglobin/transferrin/lactoferrin receptor protein [Pseudoduganella violacea]
MSGMHSPRLRPLSAAVLMTLSAAAHAQQEAGPPTPARHATVEQIMPETTVSGTGIGVSRAAYPGSVTVLDRDNLSISSGVIDALSQVPGFSAGGGSGREIGQHFNIRGFGYQSEERVIVKQDGIRRSASLFSNHISSFRMDGDLLKRVEVVKGSSSVAHGSGAIGGVVSSTTADANDFLATGAETGIATKLRYDHNNHREGYVALASAPTGSAFDVLAYVKKTHDGDIKLARMVGTPPNQFQHTDNDENGSNYFFKAGWNLAPRQRLSLSYFDMGERVETAWQTLWHAQTPATGPISGKLRQRDWSLRYTANPAGLPWLNLEASVYTAEASYQRGYDYVSSGKRNTMDYLNQDKRTGIDIQNRFAFSALGAKHRLVLGLSYERRHEDARMVSNGELSDFGSMPNTYQDSGLFVQEEMSLLDDKLVLHMGGRYDSFRRKVKNKNADYSDSNFSPRLGASYAVGGGLILLGNVSRTYRAPTPHETSSSGALNPFYWYLPNPDLKPEHSKERELGASLSRNALFAEKDRLFAKAMYFNGKISQMIGLTALPEMGPPPSSENYARYTNADLVKRRGYEIEVEYRQPLWQLDASYEHLKQVNQSTGKNYPNAFADKLRLSAGYWLTPEASIGLAVSHWRKPDQNPATYVSGKKTEYYVRDSYTIADLNLRWQPAASPWKALGRQVEVLAGVRNLFNRPYLNAMKAENTAQVGKARNIYISMSNRF